MKGLLRINNHTDQTTNLLFVLVSLLMVIQTVYSSLHVISPDDTFSQIHASITDQPNVYQISWFTRTSMKSFVKYQMDATEYPNKYSYFPIPLHRWRNNEGVWNETSNGDQVCKSMTKWPGCYHHVRVKVLPDTKRIYYTVGNGEKWKNELFMLKLPRAGPTIDSASGQVNPVQSVWYGDMGQGEEADITMQSILKFNELTHDNIDAIFHVGDIAYSDSTHNMSWYNFMNQVQPLSTRWIYMTSPGNHDSFNNMEAYLHTFHMPNNGEYYILQNLFSEVATFVSLSTEQALWPLSKQNLWMISELKRLKHDSKKKWLILYAHKSAYCSNDWGYCRTEYIGLEREEIKYSISFLIQQFNVHLFISGHTHAYERSHPLYLGKVYGNYEKPCAPVHIYAGAPGSNLPLDTTWLNPQPSWSALRLSDQGWGLLKIYNTTVLEWQYISSETLQVLDSIHLKRNDFSTCNSIPLY